MVKTPSFRDRTA